MTTSRTLEVGMLRGLLEYPPPLLARDCYYKAKKLTIHDNKTTTLISFSIVL